jgi:hypothetical protein
LEKRALRLLVLVDYITEIHGFTLGAACLVDDALEEAANGGVGERAGVDALGVFEDFALALGLIERKILGLLEFADFEGAAGTLVEELDEFAIDFIDLATPVGESHGLTPGNSRENSVDETDVEVLRASSSDALRMTALLHARLKIMGRPRGGRARGWRLV